MTRFLVSAAPLRRGLWSRSPQSDGQMGLHGTSGDIFLSGLHTLNAKEGSCGWGPLCVAFGVLGAESPWC